MTTTTYTFHDAADHSIIAMANPSNLQTNAQSCARALEHRGTARIYVHNGRGVVAALMCRGGVAHDILRNDYMLFDDQARAVRASAGLINDLK